MDPHAHRLTAEHLDVILFAAKPLTPDRREAFILDVAAALADVPVIGPGVLHRAIAAAQRQHWDAPRFATILSAPRPRR